MKIYMYRCLSRIHLNVYIYILRGPGHHAARLTQHPSWYSVTLLFTHMSLRNTLLWLNDQQVTRTRTRQQNKPLTTRTQGEQRRNDA